MKHYLLRRKFTRQIPILRPDTESWRCTNLCSPQPCDAPSPTPGPWFSGWAVNIAKKSANGMAKLLNANLEKRETSEINFQPECLYRSQWPSPRFGRCACQIPASFLCCWTSLVHSEEATAPSLSTLFDTFLDFPCMFQRPIGSSLNPAQWISMKFRLWQYQTPALGECNTANAWTKKQIRRPLCLAWGGGAREAQSIDSGFHVTVLDLCIDVFTFWGFCLVFSEGCYVACRGSVAPDFGLLCAGAGALFLFLGASKGAVLDQARLRHVLDLCSYVFTYWGFFLVVWGGCYVLGLFSCSSGVPKVPFWTRRMYRFLLWLRSDLGGVRLFRVLGGKAAFSACPG